MKGIDQAWDVITVGSGLGGLSAAAHLAALGQRVLVLEQYSVIGGSSHVFRRQGKWEFDVGVHHMGDCGPGGIVPTLYRSLGAGKRVQWSQLDPDGFETYHLPDGSFSVPRGWDAYEQRLMDTFPGERKAITGLFALMRTIAGAVDRDRSLSSMGRLSAAAARARTAAPWMMLPTSLVFKRFGFSPELELVLSAPFGSMVCPPRRLPFSVYAVFQGLFVERGSWYPRGGGQVLAAHLADVVCSHGGQILTNATVAEIVVESGVVSGVRLDDGTRLTAPVVVSNADVKKTMLDLVGPEHLRSRQRRRVAGYRMAVPFFNAYVGVNLDLAEAMPNRDKFVYPTLANYDSLERTFAATPRSQQH